MSEKPLHSWPCRHADRHCDEDECRCGPPTPKFWCKFVVGHELSVASGRCRLCGTMLLDKDCVRAFGLDGDE